MLIAYCLIAFRFRQQLHSTIQTFSFTMFLILNNSLIISFMSVFYFYCSPFVIISIESFIFKYPFLSWDTLEETELISEKDWWDIVDEDCLFNSYFSLTIYFFCWPLTYLRALIYCSVCLIFLKFFSLIL